jgi:putative SOS response-associated peptidase YedK
VCGRYTSTATPASLAEHFGVEEIRTEPLELSWNVAPTQPVYAVAGSRGVRQLGQLRWGLVPSWAESPATAARMINARAETVEDKPAYRNALARRRCIIPAGAFYEWQLTGPVDAKRTKQAWAIARRDGLPLAFAGLWEVWHDPTQPDLAPLRSCTIVTTAANGLIRPIHERMPVILPAEAWDAWLDRDVRDPAAVLGWLVPAPDDLLVRWPVGPLVNRATANGPELIEPVEPIESPDPRYAP